LSVAAATVLITTHAGSTDAHIGGAGTVLSKAAATVLINDHAALTAGIHGIAAGSAFASTADIATHAALTSVHSLSNYQLKQMVEDDPLLLDAGISADGHYCGICEAGTADAALAFGEVVYLSAASSRWAKALASAVATSGGKLAVVVSAATGAAATTTLLLFGKVNAASLYPAMSVGSAIFISAGTAGQITGTASSGTTNYVVRIIGHGNSGDELFFHPDNDYIEIA
jgi:hypothetical protein